MRCHRDLWEILGGGLLFNQPTKLGGAVLLRPSTAALVDELQSRTFVAASERHPFAKGAFANRRD